MDAEAGLLRFGGDGEQFGFSVAGGKLRGHADGVIVAGPDVGITWPALFLLRGDAELSQKLRGRVAGGGFGCGFA